MPIPPDVRDPMSVVQLLPRSLAGVIGSSEKWAVFRRMFLFFYVLFPE